MAAVVICGCRPATVSPVADPPLVAAAAIERWVDASAPEGGDGTPNRPFKGLLEALAPDAVVHLRSGLYAGPFVLPAGITLVGHGQAVLYAEGEATVVTVSAGSTLEGLSVQGGFTGVRAIGPVLLRRLHLSGHRRVAVVATGALTLEDSVLDGTVTETIGVQLQKGSTATLRKLRFTGGFRRAVDAEEATLEAEDLQTEGPAQALHLESSTSVVRRLTVAGGSGPGIFVSEGTLGLTDAAVNGHEYGLQAAKTKLTVLRFSSRRVQLAGIATVRCTGTLTDVQAEQNGTYGALQLLESELAVSGVKVKQGRTTGIFVRLGQVSLKDVTVDQIRKDADGSGGDGIHVRDADLEAKNIIVRDAEGVGLFASAAARVQLEQFSCERCRVGALVSELAAAVTVKGLISRGGEGPAIAVLDRASVKLEDADVTAVQVPIWAECDQGAKVTVKRMKSNLALPASGCIARD